ncbi:MAG: 8-oxo-dGTP pyrophosphatase MutT (NUDIX family) [Alteromonas naphthalenivorans]|jgi:8-oxo-dGTP pyrophosphatase MutT (NUDIX family)
MKRQQLLTLLENYHPTDSKEQEYKKRTLEFVNQHEDCFERTLEIGHITGSGWLLNKEETKALLLHHTKLDRWFQLGGHCDGDSDVLAVTTKECQEESGINGIEPLSLKIFDIDIHTIPARLHEPEHDHYDIRFLLKVTSDEKLVQNRESKELRWISKDPSELPTQERSVTRMFEKWLQL